MLNHSKRVTPRPPRARPPAARTAVASIAAVGLALLLLLAACGRSPSSASSGSTGSRSGSAGSGDFPGAGGSASSQLLAWSQCMRSHGIADFPDPSSNGQVPKETPSQLRVSDSQFQAARNACKDLAPGRNSPSISAKDQQDYLNAASCMRSHGIADFPDPTFSHGRVSFANPAGMSTTSPQFNQARQTCQKLIPPGLPYTGSGGGS